jgi:hypothetical protein
MGAAAGPSTTPAWTTEGSQSGSSYGIAVGTAGDVNGDGCADVLVGAEDYDGGDTEEGKAYLYMGHLTGLSDVAIWSVEGDQFEAHCGSSVGTAGDVDGDGRSEIPSEALTTTAEDNEAASVSTRLERRSADQPGWRSPTNQRTREAATRSHPRRRERRRLQRCPHRVSSYDNGEEDEG